LTQRREISRICALFKAYTGERAWKAIDKQETDIGEYSFVNRTIQFWNQLPADVLGKLSCKLSNFRKRARKVINKAKLIGVSSK
jgi:hypothetical protein